MKDLKKEGLKYIEERFEKIKKYRKDENIEFAFIVYHEINGAIDILHRLDIIDCEEDCLLSRKALDLVVGLKIEENINS